MKLRLLLVVLVGSPVFAAVTTVNLSVEEPSGVARRGWPVTSGVPFAQGALADAKVASLRSAEGRALPVQTDVLARWPDGSVRWLLVDFQTDLAPRQKAGFVLSTDSKAPATAANSVRVTSTAERTTIDTGPLKLELTREGFDPFGAVWLKGQRVTRSGGGFFVRDAKGNRFTASHAPAEIVVEENGPLRACVRVKGRHASADGAMFSYVLRLHAFAGQPFLRCSYTFINDRQDAVMTSLKELGVDVQLAAEAGPAAQRATRVYQVDENHFEVDGQPAGARARGWAAMAGARGSFAIGVREFWQQWPKSITTRTDGVSLGLCPEFAEGLYDGRKLEEENKLYYALRRGVHTFKVGLAKTHELWVNFFAGPANEPALGEFFASAEEPLLATAQPGYIDATRVAGELPPADPKRFSGYDAWFERAYAGHSRRRDQVREYGLLNWGDWFGERIVNWGNLEYDLQHGMMMQYLRTGDRRFFLRGAQAARHHIDVDVIHAVNPVLKNPWGAPPRVGEIWLHSLNHTGGYYANAPLPVELPYQMGHSANYGHVWVTGDLDYYYLTGDRRAREVAISVADMMASAMTAKVGTHIRTLGWPTILVLSAYEATGDPKYLEAATRNWQALRESLDLQRGWVVTLAGDHCLHPVGSTQKDRETKFKDQRCRGNVPFMEGLTLCALARYHRHTGDPEVLKAITVGVDQMIRECWMEDVKTFRYTACPLSSKTSFGLFMLSAEAMAYEATLTGNREHQRILQEGVRSALTRSGADGMGKGFAQMTFFTPHALSRLE